MNREFRIVMDEETAAAIAEVIKDWDEKAEQLGFPSDDRIKRVVNQIEGEKERLFKN